MTDDELKSWRKCLSRLKSDFDGAPDCVKYIDSAIRAIDQFKSGIELISCIGMLKAGKSTLINMLARSRSASPIGFGQDTTLRPAVIRMAERGNPGKIIIYDRADDEPDNKAVLLRVLDDLRGVRVENLCKRELPLDDGDMLTRVLCTAPGSGDKILPKEPALVVVETEYNEECRLLRDRNRMLLDMPGCDSPNAEVSRADLYKELGYESDLALIIQSSVAPLNEKAVEILQSLMASRSHSTVRLIQNRMEVKPWMKNEYIEAENKKQMQKAARVFSKISGVHLSSMVSVNLGMAYSGIFEVEHLRHTPMQCQADYAQQLINDSRFYEMEEALCADLPQIRRRHCEDGVKRTITELCDYLRSCINAHDERLMELRKRKDRLERFFAKAEKCLKAEYLPENVVLSIFPLSVPNFKDKCKRFVLSWKDGEVVSKTLKCSKINKCFDECNEHCRKELASFINKSISTDLLLVKSVENGNPINPLQQYVNEELLEVPLKQAEAELNAFDSDLYKEFDAEERLRLCKVKNARVEPEPLKVKNLRLSVFERLKEDDISGEPGFFGYPAAKHTPQGAIEGDKALWTPICQMQEFYSTEIEQVLNQCGMEKIINSLIAAAAEKSTEPLRSKITELLNDNTQEISKEEQKLKLLNKAKTSVEKEIKEKL